MRKTTREQAQDIARRYLREELWTGYTVRDVLAWDEIDSAKPCIYYPKPFDIENCWIVYLDGPYTGWMLKSSDIIIVSKESGEVFYAGSANDEG